MLRSSLLSVRDLVRAQRRDLIRRIAGGAKDFLRMLAETRRHQALDRSLAVDADRYVNELHLWDAKIRRHRREHPKRVYLLVGKHLVERVDRADRHARFLQLLDQS